MTLDRVASAEEIPAGTMKAVDWNGTRVCLARVEDGRLFAISDTCTHEEASLSEGEIWKGMVQCPQHGSLFDLATGRVTGLPAENPIQTYKVVETDGDVFIDSGPRG